MTFKPDAHAVQRPRPDWPVLVVTRPAEQAGAWLQALSALGCEAVSLPLIGIAPLADPEGIRQLWQSAAHDACWMFVSANAVHHAFAQQGGQPWPPGLLAAATGPGTVHALLERGVPAAQVVAPPADAAQYDSEHLWSLLAAMPWRGRRVAVVRGEEGRDWLASQWQEAGADVRFVPAYRRVMPDPGQLAAFWQQWAARRHVWSFSSSEAIRHLVGSLPDVPWHLESAICSHPRIAETARRCGFVDVQECKPEPADVADMLQKWQHRTL